jgi:hypothetical protein
MGWFQNWLDGKPLVDPPETAWGDLEDILREVVPHMELAARALGYADLEDLMKRRHGVDWWPRNDGWDL